MSIESNLRSALEGALNAQAEGGYKFIPFLEIYDADKEPDTGEARIVALLKALRAEPELTAFRDRFHLLGGIPHWIDHKSLADWLIWRASKSTIDQALIDLRTYVGATDCECVEALVFEGLVPEAACEFDNSTTLLPWGSFPDPAERDHIERDLVGRSSFGSILPATCKPTGTLLHHSKATIVISDNPIGEEWRRLTPSRRKLTDALMCIGLTLWPAPRVLGYWTQYPKWVPIRDEWRPREEKGFREDRLFSNSSEQEARSIFKAFRAQTGPIQDRVRLATQRLSRISAETVEDAAINLGIALEILYLNDSGDDKGELTFRLKIRAARFIEADPVKREAIFGLVGKLYTMRSKAVHTGRLREPGKGHGQLLAQGVDLGVRTIRRFIVEGQPDWNAVQFG